MSGRVEMGVGNGTFGLVAVLVVFLGLALGCGVARGDAEGAVDEEESCPVRAFIELTEEDMQEMSLEELRGVAGGMERLAGERLQVSSGAHPELIGLRGRIRAEDPAVQEMILKIRELNLRIEEVIDQHPEVLAIREQLADDRAATLELLDARQKAQRILYQRRQEEEREQGEN